jgi:hypothetical protein
MALIFLEHCDNWNATASFTARGWTSSGSASGGSAHLTGGRFGGGSLVRTLGNDHYTRGWYRDFSPSVSVPVVHSAFWFLSTVSSSADLSHAHYINRATIGGNACGVFTATTDVLFRLTVPIGAGGTIVGTAATNACDGGWHYIEYEIVLHQTTGTAKLWIDGQLDVTFSGPTCSAAPPLALTRWLVALHAPGNMDDMLIWDDTDIGDGWVGNLAGGARGFKTIRPTSDAAVQFTPSSGSSNYALVNEQLAATAGYVESGTDGHSDRYGFAAHGLSDVTPTGVIVETLASNPGAGAINVKMLAELSATEIESAARDVPGGYTILHGAFPTKPGGGAWSLADIDSATFGIKVDVP